MYSGVTPAAFLYCVRIRFAVSNSPALARLLTTGTSPGVCPTARVAAIDNARAQTTPKLRITVTTLIILIGSQTQTLQILPERAAKVMPLQRQLNSSLEK